MSSIGTDFAKLSVNALATGAAGAALSYAVLDRKGTTVLMNYPLAEYIADGLMIAIGSVGSDVSSMWVLPAIEDKFIQSPKFQEFVNSAASPALAGGIFVLEKKFLQQSNEPMTTNFLLGAGAKLIGEKASVWIG